MMVLKREVEGRGEEKEKERWRGEEIDSEHVLCKQTTNLAAVTFNDREKVVEPALARK